MLNSDTYEVTYLVDEDDCDIAYVRAESAQDAEHRFEVMYPDFMVVHVELEEV